MSYIITEADIFKDFRVLFGAGAARPADFIRNLPPSELKAAYRRMAFETHPDRARALGKLDAEMNRQFQEVVTAYERLSLFIQNNKKPIFADGATVYKNTTYKHAKGPAQEQRRKREVLDHFFKGSVPRQKLLIGQYLYYSGVVSWKTLIDAIIWQRKQRPRIGQIAQEWGILTPHDIRSILAERNYKDKFCEFAHRRGYITYFELMALLGRQHKLQRPLGQYFIQQGILRPVEMNKIIETLKNRNITI